MQIRNASFLYGLSDRILRYNNENQAISSIVIGVPGQIRNSAQLDENVTLLYGSNGSILKTDDAGFTFQTVPSNSNENLIRHHKFDKWVFLYGSGDTFLRSNDNGNSFTSAAIPLDLSIRGFIKTTNTLLFYGSNGAILRVSNDLADIAQATFNGAEETVINQSVLDFIADALPAHIQTSPYAVRLRNNLIEIKARRGVLDGLRDTTEAERDKLDSTINNVLLREQS